MTNKDDILKEAKETLSTTRNNVRAHASRIRSAAGRIALDYISLEDHICVDGNDEEPDEKWRIKETLSHMNGYIHFDEDVILTNLLTIERDISDAFDVLAKEPTRYKQDSKADPSVRQRVFDLTDGTCVYCEDKLGTDWHVDHVVPISAGGPDSFENYVPSCPSCNLSKNGKHVVDFIRSRGKFRVIENAKMVNNGGGS